MKWIVRIIGALLVAVLVAVGAVLLLPADRIASLASEQLSRMTGRDVTISGDVSMTFWPVLGIRAQGLDIGNADWAAEGPLLSTAEAAIGVDAAALLRGEIRITKVEAQSPTIRLDTRSDGRTGWTFTYATGDAEIATERAPADATTARPVTIARLEVRDATLIYAAEGSPTLTYGGVDLTLDWPDPAGPAEITASMRLAEDPVTLVAQVERFGTFLRGEVAPLRATLSGQGGGLTLDGRASLDGAFAGHAGLQAADTALFLSQLGAGRPEIPEGLGRRADIAAEVTLTPDRRLALRDLAADLGGNRITGAADIVLSDVPQVTATLDAGALVLATASTGGEPGATPTAAPTSAVPGGWSTAPINADFLASFDGRIVLTADRVDLGRLQFGTTRAEMTNADRRMVFALTDVAAYGGRLAGEFVMNNRGGLSVGGSLAAQGVEMNPLLRDMAELTRFTGTGDAQVSFLGSGNTLAAIMGSLGGSGRVGVGRGTIEGIDLDNLLGSYDVEGGTTVFDSLDASFTMADGVLSNDDLQMLLPRIEATGRGQVDLGARTLDYTVTPKILRVNAGRGLAVPVRIEGPWADPVIRPDLAAAVDLNFAAEKQEVTDRVQRKLDEKLQEELGVTRQDGQSVEDALKGEIENKLKRELLKIFD